MGAPARRWWDETAQTMPSAELRHLQEDRLREAVARAFEGAPFFRRRFEAAGVAPDDVKTLDDLARLPVFRKDDLRRNEAEHPPVGDYRCVGLSGSVRLATSTGTTGRPTFTLWTAADLQLDYELAARAHWRAGLRPGDAQYPGPRVLSEPESRTAYSLILRLRPRVTIWFHQPLGVVDESGGSLAIERSYAEDVGLPLRRLPRYHGSAASWQNARLPGSTAFVVELPGGPLGATAVARQRDAVLALAGGG